MSGFDEPWKRSWAREADKVKELSENNAHLRAALVKAEEERDEAITQAVLELHNQLYPVIAQRDAQLAAAERTVREQREVIEAANRLAYYDFSEDDEDVQEDAAAMKSALIAYRAASLPPVADERTEP